MPKPNKAAFAAQLLVGAAAAALAYTFLPRSAEPGQVVLITGGSRGLGLALADRFGRSGAKLVLVARNADELDRARKMLVDRGSVEHASDVHLLTADLTDAAQVQGLIGEVLDRFGRIDVLINNAGTIQVGPFENQSFANFEAAMRTNFYAALHVIQAAVPSMLDRYQQTGERSTIVNISSIGGKIGVPHLLPYVASKFALTGFSEGLHAELRHKGVRVTTVCPGLMRTGSPIQAQFTGNADEEYRWFSMSANTPGLAASTGFAANRIFNAVASGRAEITITPQAWLGARANGVVPGVTQYVSSLANEYLLPAPSPTSNSQAHTGAEVRKRISRRARKLELVNNQR